MAQPSHAREAVLPSPSPRRPRPREIAQLHAWLDDGLRDGERGRLAAEYPLTMGATGSRRHFAVYAAPGRPVAHAMGHRFIASVGGRSVPLGMIGNVFSDPAHRGRGHASACVEASVEELRRSGAAAAMLWTDQRDWYRRMGFLPAGREWIWQLRPGFGAADVVPGEVRLAEDADMEPLDRLYDAHHVRVQRPRSALRRLGSAPHTTIAVAESGGQVRAYVATGRGSDLAGVVHEWGGDPALAARCIQWLHRQGRAHSVLSGPPVEGLGKLLADLGAHPADGVFALVRILDAQQLWRCMAPSDTRVSFRDEGATLRFCSPEGEQSLSQAEALGLFFTRGASVLRDPLRPALDSVLPWPLYVWGFDSI